MRDTFNFEDYLWLRDSRDRSWRFGDITSMFVDYPKDWNFVIKRRESLTHPIASLLVKDPLVDLNPLETGLLLRFFAKLYIDFSIIFFQEFSKNFHLLFTLAQTEHRRHDRRHVLLRRSLL